MALPRIEFTPTGGVLQVLASPVPRPGNRLRGFVPDTMPIGPARPVLADGAIYGRRFRTDRLARFELPGLSPEQLETAQTLKAHLLNGGTATLATDDSADRSYTIRLAPDTVPEIRGPDERYEYAFAMTALNTAAASMVCTYGDAAVIWRADYLSAFTRASLASYHGGPSPLRVLSAASGVPRYQHYQSSRRGLLVEGAATNSILHSSDPTNAAWTKDDVTVDALLSVLGPDGVLAPRLVETAVSSVHGLVQSITIGDGQVVAVSGYFRARERFLAELIVSGGGGTLTVAYNVNTGAKTEASAGGASLVRSYIETDFSHMGWYRLVVVGTLPGGVTTAACNYNLNDDSGTTTYTGDTSKSAYWTGMQGEPGETVASVLIPTTTAPVTRNADAANLVAPFGPQPMWVYHRFTERGTIATASGRAWQVSISNPALLLYRGSGGVYTIQHHNGIVATEVDGLAVAPDIGDLVEILVQLDEQGRPDIYQSINGAAPTSVVGSGTQIGFASAWGTNDLGIGSDGSGNGVGYASHERLVIGRGSLGSGAARIMAKARSIAG